MQKYAKAVNGHKPHTHTVEPAPPDPGTEVRASALNLAKIGLKQTPFIFMELLVPLLRLIWPNPQQIEKVIPRGKHYNHYNTGTHMHYGS